MSRKVTPQHWEAKGNVVGLFMTADPESFVTTEVDELTLDFEGIVGEAYEKRRGLTLRADVRARGVSKGREIRHRQHVSIMGTAGIDQIINSIAGHPQFPEELDQTEVRKLVACSFGANILLDGISGVDNIPGGCRMTVLGEDGIGLDDRAIFEISRYNNPCKNPGQKLAEAIGIEEGAAEFAKAVKLAAEDTRGIVGGVEAEGSIFLGDELRAFNLQLNRD